MMDEVKAMLVMIAAVCLVDNVHLAIADARETGNSARLVDIGGGRKMYLNCRGTGSPTVILVGGLRASR